MASLTQGRATGVAAKAFPVEIEPLSRDPLHHVNAPLTDVTLVSRLGELPPQGTLGKYSWRSVQGQDSQRR